MNSKQAPIRAVGQRSITSSFLPRSSNPLNNSTENVNNKGTKKDSRVSFSDFLDRKLHTSSALPKTVQGKLNPFSIPGGLKNAGESTDGKFVEKKQGDGKRNNALDKVVFEQFKHNTNTEKVDTICACSIGEVVGASAADNDIVKESRKRRNPFEGANETHTTRKPFVVIGGDSKYKQKRRRENSISDKKPRPNYNHYKNGRGWWDCDMEGVDNEEVGFGEVWEGVGSTTFGGIEWH